MSPMHRESLYHSPCTMHHSFDHLVELACNLRLEVCLHLVNIGKFGKGPAAVLAVVIHAGYPVRLHGGFLFFGILAAVAFDLDNQVQRVVLAMAVIQQHDKIGNVVAVNK